MHNWLSLAPDGLPYWIVAETCVNLIRTLPQLVHDENNVEDVDTTGEDHAPDDCRYCLKALKWLDGAKIGGIKFGGKPKVWLPKWDEGKSVAVSLEQFERAGIKKKAYYPK
jgi:hypothetical protein